MLIKYVMKTYFVGFSHSKFRHLKGTPLSRNLQVENIRNLNSSLPGESDLFHANADRCAIPLSGPGGIVAVIEVSKLDACTLV